MSSEKLSTNTVPAITRRTEQVAFGIVVSILGFLVFLIGAKPEWLALDRSPVIAVGMAMMIPYHRFGK